MPMDTPIFLRRAEHPLRVSRRSKQWWILRSGAWNCTNGLITLAAQKHELNIRGNNLRAQLSYNVLSQQYRGQVSLEPIYVVSGRNTPVDFTVNLPVVLSRDRNRRPRRKYIFSRVRHHIQRVDPGSEESESFGAGHRTHRARGLEKRRGYASVPPSREHSNRDRSEWKRKRGRRCN